MKDWLGRGGPSISGSSAVEFALVAPLFLLLLFGTIAYSAIMTVENALQQLVAESARASVAGLSTSERDQIARAFIASNVATYPLIDPAKLNVTTSAGAGGATTFSVTANYDMSTFFAYSLLGTLPLPGRTVARSAVVQTGGY